MGSNRARHTLVRLDRCHRLALGALAGIVLLAACGLPPQQQSPPSRHDPDHFLEARLAADDAGNAYAAAIERDLDGERVTVRVSNNNGMDWPHLTAFSSGPFESRRHLDLCTGAPGEIYLVWIEEQGGPADVRFTRSLDGGRTWLPEDRRLSGSPSGSARAVYPRIRSDDRGNVYVVWLDDREGFAAVYANRSRDGGDTWMPWDRRVTSLGIARKGAPEMACDLEGNVYVAWAEEHGGGRRIVTNVSTDYGETWAPNELPVSAGSGATRAAIVALDGGIALLAWAESGPTSGRIYCARTLDRGQSWERPRALASTLIGLPTPPRVLQGDRTEVYIAWQIATSRSTTSVVLATSRDSGARFSEIVVERPTGISTGIVDLEGLATATPVAAAADDAGNVYFSWIETEVGSARLGFDRIGNHGRNPVHPQHGLDLQTRLDIGFPDNAIPAPVPYLEADSFGHVCLLWNAGHTLYVAASPFNGDSGWRITSF